MVPILPSQIRFPRSPSSCSAGWHVDVGILPYVFHWAEGAERDGGDDTRQTRTVPLAGARLREAPHRPGLDERKAQPRPVGDRWNAARHARPRGCSSITRGSRVAKGGSGSARAPGGASWSRARAGNGVDRAALGNGAAPARAIGAAAHADHGAGRKGGGTPARRRAYYTGARWGEVGTVSTRHAARCYRAALRAQRRAPGAQHSLPRGGAA